MTSLLAQLERMNDPVKPVDVLAPTNGEAIAAATSSIMDLLNSYAPLFVVSFLITLLITPLVRRFAIAFDIIDHPDHQRKAHQWPVAYLGGMAVFIGVFATIAISYVWTDGVAAKHDSVPLAVIVGMIAITFTGLADDIWGWDPRLKIAGQLVAAAALAIENIGVKVAMGMLSPLAEWLDPLLGCQNLAFQIPLPGGMSMTLDLVYWTGTALIAIFVLGGCNAANLIDGLDGLLSGVVAIVAIGLLAISLLMALQEIPDDVPASAVLLTGPRIVLCVALLGAVLGFLPHNFNPASIFLGDAGSHLLGYLCVVIILMFGEFGQTHLVFAGLIIFALPIMDTTLAIIRRKLSGRSMSAADDQHIHHQLRRSLGGVKRAVFALYGITLAFMIVGVTLAALVMRTGLRVRVIYAIALVLFGFIGVIALKAGRRQQYVLGKSPKAAPGVASVHAAGATRTAASETATAPAASKTSAGPV
jgi:UDP-GlcNAc:undecaprenyl-phosphate GlcNAc-1-phosphate transferase